MEFILFKFDENNVPGSPSSVSLKAVILGGEKFLRGSIFSFKFFVNLFRVVLFKATVVFHVFYIYGRFVCEFKEGSINFIYNNNIILK